MRDREEMHAEYDGNLFMLEEYADRVLLRRLIERQMRRAGNRNFRLTERLISYANL